MIKWQYMDDESCVEVSIEGTYAENELLRIASEVIESNCLVANGLVLIDNSRARRAMTPGLLLQLTAFLKGKVSNLGGLKVAIIPPNGSAMMMVRVLAAFAKPADIHVRPFSNRDDARTWLGIKRIQQPEVLIAEAAS